MGNFRKKPGAEGREERPRRGGRPADRKTADKDPKKSDGYKAKRSFTKNKSFREDKDTRRGDRPERRSDKPSDRVPFKRNYKKSDDKSDRPKRNYEDRGDKRDSPRDRDAEPARRDREKREDRGTDERPVRSRDRDDKRPFSKERDDKKPFSRERDDRRSFSREGDNKKPFDRERSDKKPFSRDRDDKKPFGRDRDFNKGEKKFEGSRPFERDEKGKKRRFSKPRPGRDDADEGARRVNYDDFEGGKAFSDRDPREDKSRTKKPAPVRKQAGGDDLIRLNKYLSNAGIASRREADTLIQSGAVKVNGVVVDQLGYKIKSTDKVTYGDAAVKGERKVYLLLNKPKDYISTVDDPQERKTVMELIAGACRERVYPVGRLDRNTTGLLLFTNDGELTTKLTHPKYGVKKVYHVSLNKGLKPDDFKAITEGVELEDGPVKADDLAFVGEGKKEIGIEIHSGRNRIVRRLFEHLGYDVLKLDRVVFAGLTKKDLPRGKHRFLTAKEISFLQMIG